MSYFHCYGTVIKPIEHRTTTGGKQNAIVYIEEKNGQYADVYAVTFWSTTGLNEVGVGDKVFVNGSAKSQRSKGEKEFYNVYLTGQKIEIISKQDEKGTLTQAQPDDYDSDVPF